MVLRILMSPWNLGHVHTNPDIMKPRKSAQFRPRENSESAHRNHINFFYYFLSFIVNNLDVYTFTQIL